MQIGDWHVLTASLCVVISATVDLMREKSPLVVDKEGVFLSSCHLTWISRRGASEGWNGPAGGNTGGESDTLVSPESVFSHIRLTSIDRERRGERRARCDQRMTGEREEESQPKQRLLLKFPCTGFHAWWERGKDMVSTPEPTLIHQQTYVWRV